MQKVLKKLRRGEIRIRKLLNSQIQGGRRSLFRGSGLEFDDVRPYQYGDEVRSIHWAISSKGHGVYVKTFREEREQVVFLVVDVSASQSIGPSGGQKVDLMREVAATLLLSATRDSNQVGMLLFSDATECAIRPKKGPQQAYKLIHKLYTHSSTVGRTNIDAALRQSLQLVRRRSIFILLSDFIDEDYLRRLRSAARRHDLIMIHIQSPQENRFPPLGILPVYEPELRKVRWLNTGSASFRRHTAGQLLQRSTELKNFAIRYGADYLSLCSGEDYLLPLVSLFRARNRRRHAG